MRNHSLFRHFYRKTSALDKSNQIMYNYSVSAVRSFLFERTFIMEREKFGSRLGFILISAGCAIGIGNVYRFPILAGAYGGAVFLFIYIAFLILLGLPVMTAELSVGRASQRSIASSFDVLEKKGQKWHLMKYIGIGGNYILMMCYTTITSWFVTYFFKYVSGSVMDAGTTPSALGEVFTGMIQNPYLTLGVASGVIFAGLFVCSLGLQKGVEKITKVMMVMLFVLMLGLVVYSLVTMDGTAEALKFYLVPSKAAFENNSIWEIISAALGQSFFTLSIGIGSIAIFGSYIGKDRRLLGESVTIISLDTAVALMSGFIVFPAFFTYNPGGTLGAGDAGASFLFITLSSIFNNMGTAGRILGSFFFLFMVFAAMSTVIAVFENIMSFWLETTKLKRPVIALINVVLVIVLALPAMFSYNLLSDVTVLGKAFIDLEDFLVSNVFLPVGSLFYILFCMYKFGWGWDNFMAEANCGDKGPRVPKWIRPYTTFVLPVIIIVVLVMSVVTNI